MNFHEFFNILQKSSVMEGFDKILDSLRLLDGMILIPRDVDGGIYNFLPLISGSKIGGDDVEFIEFKKVGELRPIVGIDSSVVPVAESRDGFVVGVKGSVVYNKDDYFEVCSIGPIPIYISLSLVNFYRVNFGYSTNYLRRAALDVSYAKRFAVDLFEKIILNNVIDIYSNIIVLIDGSLFGISKASGYNPHSLFRSLVKKGISLVGISKRSNLLKKYPDLYIYVVSREFPGGLRLPKFLIGSRYRFFETFIARFGLVGFPFRVDVFRVGESVSVLNEIYSSINSDSGYPEVLKESHILSKFSRFEVIALRKLLESFGANYKYTYKVRDLIFGAYNRALNDGGGL